MVSFYASHWQHIQNALMMNASAIASSAQAARLACCRQLLVTMTNRFDDINQFVAMIASSIIRCLDTTFTTRARSNAAKWLCEVCQRLIDIGVEIDKTVSTVLKPIFDIIYAIANESSESDDNCRLQNTRCTLLALAIISQKHVKQFDASHSSQLVAYACTALDDGRPAARYQAIRLVTILVRKLPDYSLYQFKERIVDGVFGQLTADVTQRVRRANRRLLESLVDRFGVEVLAKCTDKSDWTKQLKNIAKMRRRSVRKREEEKKATTDIDSRSMRSGADTIAQLLADSDDEEDDDDDRKSRKSNSVG